MNLNFFKRIIETICRELCYAGSCFDLYSRTCVLLNTDLAFFEHYKGYFVIANRSLFNEANFMLRKIYDKDYGKHNDTCGIEKIIEICEKNLEWFVNSKEKVREYNKKNFARLDELDIVKFLDMTKVIIKEYKKDDKALISRLKLVTNSLIHPKEEYLVQQKNAFVEHKLSNEDIKALLDFAVEFYQTIFVMIGETPYASTMLYLDELENMVKDFNNACKKTE